MSTMNSKNIIAAPVRFDNKLSLKSSSSTILILFLARYRRFSCKYWPLVGECHYCLRAAGMLVITVAMLVHGCGNPNDEIIRNVPLNSETTTPLFPETIFIPEGIGTYTTGKHLADGTPETVSCMTCHATLAATAPGGPTLTPRIFHQETNLIHGNLECMSCHDRNDRDKLRLASGTTLEYTETVKLCAQCHGLQYRDYTHGAHGGMNGYWDRTKGERIKNACVVCHQPHNPKIQPVVPALVPNDRFLDHADHLRVPTNDGEHTAVN